MNESQKNVPANSEANDGLVEIIGVRFKDTGKVYYFAPGKITATAGDSVIVVTARGLEYGFVAEGNRKVSANSIVQPLRRVVRIADKKDTEQYERNRELEESALEICKKKIVEHGLEMKLIEAEYTFDNTKLIFYFTAESRVVFRELVKDLASVFKTRIELRQIGIRDEAKMLGGIGICGRPFCCSSFLSDFVQVSIKMAKEQNLSLNSSKISGTCGRLMCCLKYEQDAYEYLNSITPPVGSYVKTVSGNGIVVDENPLTGTLYVRIGEDAAPIKVHRTEVELISRGKKGKPAPKKEENEE